MFSQFIFYHRDYTRTSIPENAPRMGIHDPGYVARIWLYIFFGILDAMWQITAYWIMGAMSNDPAKLAYFTGLCMSPFLSDMFTVAECCFLIRQVYPICWCCWHLACGWSKDSVCSIHILVEQVGLPINPDI